MTTVNLPDRISRLYKAAVKRGGAFPDEPNPFILDVALWRAWRPGMSIAQTRATMLLEAVRLMPVVIRPDQRIVGAHILGLNAPCSGFQTGESANAEKWFAKLGVAEGDFDAVRQRASHWNTRAEWPTEITLPPPGADDGKGEWSGNGRDVFWAFGWQENHSIRDYGKVLRVGFGGIRAEIEAERGKCRLDDPDLPRRESFWNAALAVCDAGMLIGRRHAEAARALAASAGDPAERARLEGIAARCEWVSEHGARTLAEAVQAFWFAHVLTCGEDGINANSIGHMDQFLNPAYEADMAAAKAAGKPVEEVSAAADELLAELSCLMYLNYDVQAISLGGCDACGRSAANAISQKILETTRALGQIRDISIRVRADTPPELMRTAAEMICEGGGVPFLFNDEAFIPALVSHGVNEADAWDYAPLGCVELTIPGKADPHAVSGWFDIAKCVELALFDGVDPRLGVRLGPATGMLRDHRDFESFWHAYDRQVRHFAERMAYHCNRGELQQRSFGPQPCWSTLTDDCIARGRDLTDGGARYFYHSVCLLGTANAADSLAALKKFVFDGKSLDPDELLDALRADFVGYEGLRQRLVHDAPKYGNGIDEVDMLAKRVDDHFIDLMDALRSPQGGRYFVHLFSFYCNLDFGRSLGATPDGRKAGEPLAYSLSAQQGRDIDGATALMRSIAKMPHRRAAGGSAAIVELDPAVVGGPDGPDRLLALVNSAFGMGVGQLQFNVVTAERLLKAQADPEHYGDIPVRVAGYSQKFRLVPRDLQDHIIARTKHRR